MRVVGLPHGQDTLRKGCSLATPGRDFMGGQPITAQAVGKLVSLDLGERRHNRASPAQVCSWAQMNKEPAQDVRSDPYLDRALVSECPNAEKLWASIDAEMCGDPQRSDLAPKHSPLNPFCIL